METTVVTAGMIFSETQNRYCRERLADLKKEATPKFTSADAKAGKEGKIFFQITPSSGVVLRVKSEGGEVFVRIIASLGVAPIGWIKWDSKKESWPDERLFSAFEAWKNS